MTLVRMYWLDESEHRRLGVPGRPDANGGYDLHVVRDATSRSLRHEIVFSDGAHVFTLTGTHPTTDVIDLRFVPRFVPESDDGTNIEGHGARVEIASGRVTGIAPTGAVRAHNFILEAIAVVKDTAAPDGRRTLPPLRVRVHVHDRLKRAWLTPTPLTAFRGVLDQRFTLLGELETDGQPDPPLIGDLTRLPGLTWSSSSAAVAFESNGDITVVQPDDASDATPVDVTVKLPAAWGGATIIAQVLPRSGWHEMPSEWIRAHLIAGPGYDRLAEVPNVLFLPEGFTAEQEGAWDNLIRELVEDVARSKANHPFDLLFSEGSINVWSVFIPSRQAGMSHLFELTSSPQPGSATVRGGLEIEGVFFPAPADTWQVEMLHAEAGLPMRSDETLTQRLNGDGTPNAEDLAARQAKFAAALARWHTIYGAAQVPAAKVTFELWDRWTESWFRTLVDERDTAFSLVKGERPSLTTGEPFPGFHPYRIQRDDVDKLLARIQDGDGPIIGHVWTPKPGSPSPSRPEAGKDRNLVYVLLAGAPDMGVESDHNFITSAVADDKGVQLEVVDHGFRLRVKPYDLPLGTFGVEMSNSNRRTVLHELAHAFGLQDEYSDVAGSLPTQRHADLLDNGNIQPEAELVDAAGRLLGDQLRWRWPRIERAAVLSAPPWKGNADEWVIPLRRGQKHRFKNDDVVFLRQRPLLRIPDPAGPQVLTHAKVSGPLVVISDMQEPEQIVVRAATPIDPADFPADPPFESIVFIPVPPPAYAVGDTSAELVPRLVRDHITTTGLPLNRTAGTTCLALPAPTFHGSRERGLLLNLPAHDRPFWVTNQWIGAFDGGVRFGCGVYHPSSWCVMNSLDETTPFCPVCAYLLVDAIDPALHGIIDRHYDATYVEPPPP